MKVSDLIETISDNLRPERHPEEVEAMDRIRRSMKFRLAISTEAYEAGLAYAREMFKFDIFKLPFDECYFEMRFYDEQGESIHATLCWQDGNKVFGRLYVWYPRGVVPTGATFDVFSILELPPMLNDEFRHANYKRDNTQMLLTDQNTNSHNLQKAAGLWGPAHVLAGVGALTLSGLSKVRYIPDGKLNKARQSKGKEPFYSHTELKIDADPDKQIISRYCLVNSRNAPRLHWRRGHIRRAPNSERLIQIRPCLVGDRSVSNIPAPRNYVLA